MRVKKLYSGFGETHSAGTWAKLLNVPRNTLWRILNNGGSVEEFARSRGIEYKPGNHCKRWGKRMAVTEFLVRDLLTGSGYDPDRVTVRNINGARHLVMYAGQILGVYSYQDDRLGLSGGESLKLVEPVVNGQKVQQVNGAWEIHPTTRAKLRRAFRAEFGE